MKRTFFLFCVCLILIMPVLAQSRAVAIGEGDCDLETVNQLVDMLMEQFTTARTNARTAADVLTAVETLRDRIDLMLEACSGQAAATESAGDTGIDEPAAIESMVGEPIMFYVIRPQTDAGIPIGCNDSAVTIETGEVTTGDVRTDLRTAIDALLADDTLFSNGNINALRGNTLRVLTVTVRDDLASIGFSGSVDYEDACEAARMEVQIVLTVFQFPTINRFLGTMGGRNMRQFFGDLDAGLSGEYLRENFLPGS